MMRSVANSGVLVGLRQALPAAMKAIGETRTAIPLSLLFASLLVSCEQLFADCGEEWYPMEKTVVLSELEFRYFTYNDGVLDASDCPAVCTCRAPGYLSMWGPDGGFVGLPADASGDAGDGDGMDDTGAGGASADSGRGGSGGGGGAGAAFPTPGLPGSCSSMEGNLIRIHQCMERGVSDDGHTVHCQGEQNNGVTCGRNSACLASLGRGVGASAVARWLAFSAATEAGSIRSFQTLRRELCELGAPLDFVTRARRAAREEARHTRWMARLARDRGGKVAWPRSVRLPLRDLEAVASENAVEGCVRETWSALLNHHQAVHASDPEVRAVMTRIAVDETSHAELAHDIDRWAMKVLPAAARARVARAKRAAARDLAATLVDPEPSLCAVLGLPGQSRLRFLARELEERLWS